MRVRWRHFLRWVEDHRRGLGDLFVLLWACALTAWLVLRLDLGARFLAFAQANPQFDPLACLLVLAASAPFFAIFAWRRWREATGLLADADTDALTGLGNRRKAERILDVEFDRCLRYERPLALIMFDIDHFKRINDGFGHPAGDMVLKRVARRVRRKMRNTDYLVRWGGEEFLLVCPETELDGAIRIAERIRRAIGQRPISRVGVVTASFGVAAYAHEGTVGQLIAVADRHLYVAKQQGRDRVVGRADGSAAPPEPAAAGTQLSQMLSTVMAPVRKRRTGGRR